MGLRDILTRPPRPVSGRFSPSTMRTVEPLEGTNISLFNTIIPNWWAENGHVGVVVAWRTPSSLSGCGSRTAASS
jgi:hypothetical protein